MNWTAINTAIMGWMLASSGLTTGNVVWERNNKGRPPGNGPFLSLLLRSLGRIGQDWVDVEDNFLTLVDDDVDAVLFASNELTVTAHAYVSGDGPVQLTTTGTLPTGLALLTGYWIIVIDANTIQLAASFKDSKDAVLVPVTFSDDPAGTHTIEDTPTTVRAGIEVNYVQRGERSAILTVQYFRGHTAMATLADTPEAILEGIMANLNSQANRALLDPAVGILSFGNIIAGGVVFNSSIFEPRAIMDIRLSLQSEVIETGTYIERVLTEGTLDGDVHTNTIE